MKLLVEAILFNHLQSIAVSVWRSSIKGKGATKDAIDFFRSNPLHLQQKERTKTNTFTLRGTNTFALRSSLKFDDNFFLVPVNFTRWREGSCEVGQPHNSRMVFDL